MAYEFDKRPAPFRNGVGVNVRIGCQQIFENDPIPVVAHSCATLYIVKKPDARIDMDKLRIVKFMALDHAIQFQPA